MTRVVALGWLLPLPLMAGCGEARDPAADIPAAPPNVAPRQNDPPVPLDPDPAVEYPAALAAQRIGGTAFLRLFVDSAGRVVAESTRIQESSGYPALDSAALASAARLSYAPALRDGVPVAAPFLQPFNFRSRSGGTNSR